MWRRKRILAGAFWALALGLAAGMFLPPELAQAAAQVQITNLSDVNFGSWGLGDPDLTTHLDLCVYAGGNSPAGGYAITASGSGGSFALRNGSNQLPFSASWDDGGAGNLGGSSTTLGSGGKLAAQVNANTSSPTCFLSSPTARLTLKLSATNLTAALAGTYTGTITLTLSPN